MTEHPDIPAEPTEALALVRDVAAHVASAQLDRRDPAHEEFYLLGSQLSGCLSALGELAGTLTHQVADYGDHRVLRDDAGADPTERLALATGHLEHLGHTLEQARQAAEAYWATIGHIAVEVDPDAESEDE